MPLTYNELAENLREEYPGKYSLDEWTNERLAKRFLTVDPALKDYVSDWESLYAPTSDIRAGDVQFAAYQAREMFSGIPEWFLGTTAAITGSENIGALAEEKRAESAQWTEDYLAENPEIAGYLKWIEEEPVTLDNWWHLEIFQRSLAQAAPSMVTMMATDLMLIPITGGIPALINKARTGQKLLTAYRAASRLKGTKLARTAGTMGSMGVYEAAGEYSEAMNYLVDEKGMDPLVAQETAAASAMIVGTLNGVIEYMPYGMFKNQLFTSAAKKEANSRIIRRVADSFLKDSKVAKGLVRIGEGAIKQGLAEGGQEWTQHMVQTLSQYAYKSGYGDTEETAFEEFIKQTTSPEAVSAFHAGGSMGVVMGGAAIGGQGLLARQRRVLEREDEIGISFEGERPPPLDVEEEGITVEAKPVEEDLSKNELIMRSFTGQNVDNLSLNTQVAMDAIEEEFGSPTDIPTDPEIEANWKGALEDIVTEDPEALGDIPDRDLALEAIEERLGEDFRGVVEEAWTPPVEEVEPTVVPPVTEIEEEPMPGEVVEREAPKDLFKKKAPAEKLTLEEEQGISQRVFDKLGTKYNVEPSKLWEYDESSIPVVSSYGLAEMDAKDIAQAQAELTSLYETGKPAEAPAEGVLTIEQGRQLSKDLKAKQKEVSDLNEEYQVLRVDQELPRSDPKVQDAMIKMETARLEALELEKKDYGRREVKSLDGDIVIKEAMTEGKIEEIEAKIQTTKEWLAKQEAPVEEKITKLADVPKIDKEIKEGTIKDKNQIDTFNYKKKVQNLWSAFTNIARESAANNEIRNEDIALFNEVKDLEKNLKERGIEFDKKLPESLDIGQGAFDQYSNLHSTEKNQTKEAKLAREWVDFFDGNVTGFKDTKTPSVLEWPTREAPAEAPAEVEVSTKELTVAERAKIKKAEMIEKWQEWVTDEEALDIVLAKKPGGSQIYWVQDGVEGGGTFDLVQGDIVHVRPAGAKFGAPGITVTKSEILDYYANVLTGKGALQGRLKTHKLLKPSERYLKAKKEKKVPVVEAPAEAPVINDIKEVKGNRFANEKEIDEVQEVDISETREGLADIEGTSDYRNFNNINAKINHALGIRMFKETEKAWHTQQIIGNYANADEAIDATIEEFTTIKDKQGNIITPGIRPEVLTPGMRNALRRQYYSLHNLDRTNQNDPSKNDQVNAEVILPTHGIPKIQIKKEKNRILKKTNPVYTTSLSAVTDRDLVWISPRDIYDRKIKTDLVGNSTSETNSRYQPITTNEVLALHYSEANKGLYAFSFVRGEGKIAFTKINPEHKELAKDIKKLEEYWKNEGMSKEDIGNYILDPSLKYTFPKPDGTGDIVLDPVNISAANVARYEAIKRHYPKFLDDPGGMPNVFKRIKIPMTPTIQLKDFRPVKVKIVDKDNLAYVYSDRVVKATETGIYKGDGGTPTSKQFFKDSARVWGEGTNSRVSKNVIYENNELGTLMGKHLMFQPQGNALIYENHGKENEKLIGELRDGDIYAFSKPKAWTKTSLDKYLKDNDLIGADSKRLIDVFTDETADNIGRLTSAVNSVLEAPKFKELSLPSINDQLEFISSKEGLLKQLVRKVASPEEMELIDHLLTSDEAKVTTDSFGEFAKSGETFEVQGESLGFIYSTEGRKDKTPYPDQHHNYVRDEALQQAWSDYYIPKMRERIRRIFTKARGKVIDNIASFANNTRDRDTESIDDPTADSFEVGMGLHYSGAQFLDVLMQKRGVVPAVQVANQKGISEKMQSDIQNILERNEVSPSKKNANTVYESYARDKGISFKEAKKSASIEDINEWLADENTPDVYLLGFRSPTPYVHGAGMVRVHSIHDSSDVVFMHYLDIKVNYEADGDGDTFNMVALPDELTTLYREYYESDEIRQQLKAIDLNDFLPKKPREYKFSNINDMAALTSALMRGKNAIPEIAKTQRIYGQLLDREFSMKIEGVKIGLRAPGSLKSTDDFKPGSKYTMSDYLRIYLQAAVDNGKYMLLDKWDYSNEKLRRSLFITEDKEDITDIQWKAIKIVVDTHGLNGQIRKGKDSDVGIYGLKTMLEKSGFYLSYTQDREGFIRNKIAERYPDLYVSEINFKEGLSNQEAAAVQPAMMYNDMARTGEEGSPFAFNMARHQDAHDVAIQGIQSLKEKIVESDSGLYYGQDMGQDLYDMFDELADAGVEIGFLGWSHNEKMVDFAEKYSKKFNALSDNAKKVATFTFLEGVKRLTGKTVHYPLNLPPMSKRENGISLLDHKVMRSYFKKYNDRLLSPENTRDDVIKANSRHTGFITFIAKNCL